MLGRDNDCVYSDWLNVSVIVKIFDSYLNFSFSLSMLVCLLVFLHPFSFYLLIHEMFRISNNRDYNG